jgi:hypothetical protein
LSSDNPHFAGIDPATVVSIAGVATRLSWNLGRLTQAAVGRLAKLAGATLESAGCCPACLIQEGSTHTIVGLPVLDAVDTGLVRLSPRTDRNLLASEVTQFVFCPYCDWTGYPSAASLPDLRSLRSILRERH